MVVNPEPNGNHVSETLNESLGQASHGLKPIFLRYLELVHKLSRRTIRRVDQWMVTLILEALNLLLKPDARIARHGNSAPAMQ